MGWAKLDKEFIFNVCFRDPETVRLYMYILSVATWQEEGAGGLTRGQVRTSQWELVRALNLSRSAVRWQLKKLEENGYISVAPEGRQYTLLTVKTPKNYNQGNDQENNQRNDQGNDQENDQANKLNDNGLSRVNGQGYDQGNSQRNDQVLKEEEYRNRKKRKKEKKDAGPSVNASALEGGRNVQPRPKSYPELDNLDWTKPVNKLPPITPELQKEIEAEGITPYRYKLAIFRDNIAPYFLACHISKTWGNDLIARWTQRDLTSLYGFTHQSECVLMCESKTTEDFMRDLRSECEYALDLYKQLIKIKEEKAVYGN